jgi:Regulator of ribonuclease activity B
VNPKSWETLQARGVDERTALRLDFEFTAPGEAEVRSLMAFLRSATDYEVQGGARDQQDGSRRWLVLGSTSATTWSLQRLDEWVTEMTAHGREHGPAQFDGWGASVPELGSVRGRQGFWERFALGRRGR